MTITTSAAGEGSTTRSTAVARSRATTSTSLVFVIPVYNEEANLPRLLAEFEARPALLGDGSRVILVDDGSRDRTPEIVAGYAGPVPLELVQLDRNRGPGAAFRAGFDAALADVPDDGFVVTLEGDTTSDLDALPEMLERAAAGADLVVASWRMVNVSRRRRLLSAGAGFMVRHALGLDTHTVSSFFRVYRVSALRAASDRYGSTLIEEEGFACAAELLAKLSRIGDADRRGAGLPRLDPAGGQEQDARRGDRPWLPADAPARPRRRGAGARVKPRVAIVGAGILGMSAAYRLAQAGVSVAVFERSRDLGGLVGSFDLDGRPVDRFYHVILPTDDRVIGLATEVGLGGRFRFRPTKVGFYGDGRLFSMTSPLEFLRFPLFGPAARARLASFVVRCQMTTSHSALDDEPLLDWLRKTSGRRVTERLWKPLLDSKFDGRYDDLPATYIWARSRRMATTRDRSGREVMGWIEGGYQTLIDALERRIRELGGKVHPGTAVSGIVSENGRATGVIADGSFVPADFVLSTLAPPQTRTLLAPDLAARVGPDTCRYLGVVCLLLRVSRSVSPYYHLNITDRRVPLTTLVETTHVVDPDHVGRPPPLRLEVRRSLTPGPRPPRG